MKWIACIALVTLCLGCSDDGAAPATDGGVKDGVGKKDVAATDGTPPTSNLPKAVDDQGNLPWPDLPAFHDTTPWNCKPGAAGMCDDNKFHHCDNGKCAKCPPNYVDCDRTGDCECFGACKGDKCVGGK